MGGLSSRGIWQPPEGRVRDLLSFIYESQRISDLIATSMAGYLLHDGYNSHRSRGLLCAQLRGQEEASPSDLGP